MQKDKYLYILFSLITMICIILSLKEIITYGSARIEYSKFENAAAGSICPDTVSSGRYMSAKSNKTDSDKYDTWYEDFCNINNDFIGILEIPSLDICYPLVQGKDNEKYLHTTFEGNQNPAGCIFLDSENKKDMSDEQIFIYGHNMKDGSMFGKLNRILSDDKLKENTNLLIHMRNGILEYELAEAKIIDLKDKDCLVYDLPSVTLYTCWGNDKNKKLIVRFLKSS